MSECFFLLPPRRFQVDLKKIRMEIMKKWMIERVTQILGVEDDITSNTIINYVEQDVGPKKLQVNCLYFSSVLVYRFMGWKHACMVIKCLSLLGKPIFVRESFSDSWIYSFLVCVGSCTWPTSSVRTRLKLLWRSSGPYWSMPKRHPKGSRKFSSKKKRKN